MDQVATNKFDIKIVTKWFSFRYYKLREGMQAK